MQLSELTVRGFADLLGSDAPAPGGGSAAALAGALGAALTAMVGSLTVGKKKYAEFDGLARETLEKAREHGIEKVRICCDHYNVASAKTIRANGGVLEDECFDSSDGTLTQRYWIQNK